MFVLVRPFAFTFLDHVLLRPLKFIVAFKNLNKYIELQASLIFARSSQKDLRTGTPLIKRATQNGDTNDMCSPQGLLGFMSLWSVTNEE